MAETKPQNLQNHVRYDPLFHFFLAPVGLLLVLAAAYNLYKNPGASAIAHLVAGIWAFVAVFKIRLYSLKVQDRVIRVEERLRCEKLLPAALNARVYELTEQQFVALRFASDAELQALVEKTLNNHLPPKDIKRAIRSWRPDYWRV